MRILLPTLLLLLTPVATACDLGTAGDVLPDCPPQDDPVSDLCRSAAAAPAVVEDAHAFANDWLAAADRPGQTACEADPALCAPGAAVDLVAGGAWALAVVSVDTADFFVDALAPVGHLRDDDAAAWNDTADSFTWFLPEAGDLPLLCGLGYETACALAGLPPQAQRDAHLVVDQGGVALNLAPGVAYDAAHASVHALRDHFAARQAPCPPLP